jgi:hypothetical protein
MALVQVRHKEGSGVTGIIRGTLEKSSKVVIDLDVGRKVIIRKILINQTTTL